MQHCSKLMKIFVLIVILCFLGSSHAVESFNLDQVKLLDGPFKHAQDVNLEHLLQYDVDRLLAPFLKEAGLEPKGELYPNWAGLDGHIGGHYLSAMAMYVAATGDKECKLRMEYMLDELRKCQQANGDGYIGGVPDGKRVFAAVAAGNPSAPSRLWVPWYNIHKLYAGLRDAWIYGKSPLAKQMLIEFADWCDVLLKDYTPEMMEIMMGQEYGGMNEVLADVYVITGDKKYLELAKRFSHRQLLTPMSEHKDTLDNKHANTQVPKAVGFARIAELSGDETFDEAAQFFWQTVTENRSTAFGGNSRREHFPPAQQAMDMIEEREGPETCNTYNMLKLSEILFRYHPEAKYADYYERAVYNHILSTQHPEHGGYVYFTPARPRHYRVYSAPNEGMWCCVGSGMENHSKYGSFIYSHEDDSLYVNLFIASELNWQDKGVILTQQTKFPDAETTKLTVKTESPVQFKLKIRHPEWVPTGKLQITVNGKKFTTASQSSSYAEIDGIWQNGDIIEVSLPMSIRTENMPYVSDYVAILDGPILLAAKTGTEDLQGLVADDGRWSHIAHGQLLPLNEAPMLVTDLTDVAEKVTPVTDSSSMKFVAHDLIKPNNYSDLVLEPFFRVHDARYSTYWKVIAPADYDANSSQADLAEQAKLKLDARTVDRVIPGEQQPEADHMIKQSGSEIGTNHNRYYRHAQAPGWFSYEMKIEPRQRQELFVTYWGNERFERTFDILIDGEVLATENISNKWNKDEFVDVTYSIPRRLISGKELVTIMFKPKDGNYAGGVYDIRILKVERRR